MTDEYFTDEDVEEAVELLSQLDPQSQAQALSELGFNVELEEADPPITASELQQALAEAEAEGQPEPSIWENPQLREEFGEELAAIEARREGHRLTPREVERLASAFESQHVYPADAAERGAVHNLDDTEGRREWMAEQMGAEPRDEPPRDYGPASDPSAVEGESE